MNIKHRRRHHNQIGLDEDIKIKLETNAFIWLWPTNTITGIEIFKNIIHLYVFFILNIIYFIAKVKEIEFYKNENKQT